MKLNLLHALFCCLLYVPISAQQMSTQLTYESVIPNVNIIATLPMQAVSYQVSFASFNNNLVLLDTFESNLGIIDSFSYHQSNDTLWIDQYYANAAPNYCLYANLSGSNYSAYKIRYDILPMNSFNDLTVFYSGKFYQVHKINNSSVSYTPNEFLVPNYTVDVSLQNNSTTAPCSNLPLFEIQNGKLWMNYYATHDLCAMEIYRTQQVNDSLRLDARFSCATQCGLGVSWGCYAVEIADTNFTELFVFLNAWMKVTKQPNGSVSYTYSFPLSDQTLTLSGNNNGETAFLSWQMKSDLQPVFFELFASKGSSNFTKIAQLSNTETSYTHPLDDTYSYRLLAIDADGKTISSNVVTLNKQGISPVVNISPNPTQHMLRIILPNDETYSIEVMNALGVVVKSKTSNSSFQFDLYDLPNGIYYIRIANETGDIQLKERIVLSK
ncbi:MAG: T9SS type A sorting domain-containing protein [Chitinophagaceae bacterium]|nr:T9SS type A sorting domain-containing protein [Chitinophagaceae bacterium]